jgi:hypothetical protein
MTTTDAVIASGIVMTGSTLARRKRLNQGAYMQTLLYGFILTIVLLLIGLALPEVAKWLAILGMVGALVVNGPELFKFVAGLTK